MSTYCFKIVITFFVLYVQTCFFLYQWRNGWIMFYCNASYSACMFWHWKKRKRKKKTKGQKFSQMWLDFIFLVMLRVISQFYSYVVQKIEKEQDSKKSVSCHDVSEAWHLDKIIHGTVQIKWSPIRSKIAINAFISSKIISFHVVMSKWVSAWALFFSFNWLA